MPTQETVYKEPNKLSKSIGAGMKSLIGGSGRKFFIIEHKNTSAKHHAGEHQEIIVDYAEMGRDAACQVSFGDSFPTVSRKHAAICSEGGNWVLKQLSATNPTLINGQPIKQQFYLKNGDEIQLSMEGPKIAFLVPANNSVKSINFTRRLNLFRKQALRPYKQALAMLSVLLIAGLGTTGYFLIKENERSNKLEADYAQTVEELAQMVETAEVFQGNVDSLQQELAANAENQARLKSKLRNLENSVNRRPPAAPSQSGGAPAVEPPAASASMTPLFPSVYFMKVEKIVINFQGESQEVTDYKWVGTGFLMNDGRFVTARHCIKGWLFFTPEDAFGQQLSILESNGATVVAHIKAYSPDGSSLSFKSTDFTMNDSSDDVLRATDNDGNDFLITKANLDETDWSYARTNKNGVIVPNPDLSTQLPQMERLFILGYPLGIGASNEGVSPIYGNSIVSTQGLQDGVIMVTDRNFEQGNSGGPAFILKDGEYQVVGIISAGLSNTIGFIVPIKELN